MAGNPVDVVIAEDSRIQAKMLQRTLTNAGYQVRWAPNGAEALRLVRESAPAIIVSDIEMPEMTGYEFCEAVKSDAELRRIPLILLSTLSSPEDIIKGLHVGADNYVTKPYDPTYLLSRVDSLLKTPLGEDRDEQTLDVTLAGQRYTVRSGRQQTLNLLISTFENAVEKNNELIRVNQELSSAKDKLARWNEELGALNVKLESANTRMTRDLEAAARVQQSLLPTEASDADGVRFAWTYVPCDELAGDFLNYFPLDDHHVALYVVDVSGHGVASSLLSVTVGRFLTPQLSSSSVLLQAAIDDRGPRLVPPGDVAGELNGRFPMDQQNGLYFTMVYGVLDTRTGKLRYASAGHPAPIHLPVGQAPRPLPAEGLAIGWIDGMDFDEVEVELQPGDRVYFYSDGVPEAMDEEINEFTDERMLEVIARGGAMTLDESVAALQEAVDEWCRVKGPRDDISILALEMPAP